VPEPRKAVPRVAKPDTSRCAVFERGHHAHPVQVSMAMKRGADDHRFVTVSLVAVSSEEREVGDPVAQLDLHTEDGELLILLNHDAQLVDQLSSITDQTFVWEAEFGVLFPLTDQAREVLGTGAVTLADESSLGPCASESR
jgi:hypothetical protein